MLALGLWFALLVSAQAAQAAEARTGTEMCRVSGALHALQPHFSVKLEKADCAWWSWCSKPSAHRAFEDGRGHQIVPASFEQSKPLCTRRSPSLVEFPYFRLDQLRWSELSCSKSSTSS